MGRASVPSGASAGTREAWELRDADGRGVKQAVANVMGEIQEALAGENAANQANIDQIMIDLDGTDNKSRLGANALLATSRAVMKAVAEEQFNGQLWRYIGGDNVVDMPTPIINIINGGAHASNNIEFQEFMIQPANTNWTMKEALDNSATVFHQLKKILKERNIPTTVGDEGGFAPDFDSPREALDCIREAVDRAGFKMGRDFLVALDVAASEFYKDGKYFPYPAKNEKEEATPYTSEEMIQELVNLRKDYPEIISIEDGLAEEDWKNWKILKETMAEDVQIVGDDLTVTTPKYIKRGIEGDTHSALLTKDNQVGTVTETLMAIEISKAAGHGVILSHRSGETEDTTIADIAVATGAKQIKTGSMSRSDRMAKYNQLLRIDEEIRELGNTPIYHGGNATVPSAYSNRLKQGFIYAASMTKDRQNLPEFDEVAEISERQYSTGQQILILHHKDGKQTAFDIRKDKETGKREIKDRHDYAEGTTIEDIEKALAQTQEKPFIETYRPAA
jgi:enolase